jgi:hypothetical protein
MAPKNYPAKGIVLAIFPLPAGRVCIDICLHFFGCIYYQNDVSGSLVISSYFYCHKIKKYAL